MNEVKLHTEFIGDEPPPEAEVMLQVFRHMYRGAKRAGDVLEAAVRGAMAPNAKSSRSMRSVTSEVTVLGPDHLELTVGSSDPAVKFMTDGTGIFGPLRQIIRPVKARVMKFPHRGVRYGGQVKIAGDFAYAHWIKGIQPRNYFEAAHEASKFVVAAIFDETADQIAQVI
jgi:hypothetical protein